VIAENEPQHVKLIRPVEQGGYGMDALWNDDFHHTALVSVTGRSEAYYSDHWGRPQEIISAIKWGFLFQGQRYSWQKKSRGTPAFGIPHERFVHYIENHDQIANSGSGARIHQLTSPGRYRAITAVLLLAPATPMLFQGQEFAASSPFLFFADHKPELAALVRQGRREFISQFPSLAGAEIQRLLADPCDPATFEHCKLDFAERKSHGAALRLHRDLLRLRREDPVFRVPRGAAVDGAVLGSEALVLRFFSATSGDRLLVVNLGRDLRLEAVPEPLLAPPEGHFWQSLWHSEDPCYGGGGVYPLETDAGWRIPAQAAIAIAALRTGAIESGRGADARQLRSR
jgi:maltooligosyltrehalose trehalohydrolase